jgi:hypothetical protein
VTVAWVPEFWEVPAWIAGFDLVFAEASSWRHRIRFAGGVGGHACVMEIAAWAKTHGVRRLVFAHIGRPTIRAMERGERATFGEFGWDGEVLEVGASHTTPKTNVVR